MSDEDLARQGSDEDFQRWYLGGSPPADGHWPRHAFEDALFAREAHAPNQRDLLALIPRSTEGRRHETGNNRGSDGSTDRG